MSNKSSLVGKYYRRKTIDEKTMNYDDAILHKQAKELKRKHKRERQNRRKGRK